MIRESHSWPTSGPVVLKLHFVAIKITQWLTHGLLGPNFRVSDSRIFILTSSQGAHILRTTDLDDSRMEKYILELSKVLFQNISALNFLEDSIWSRLKSLI